MIGQMLETALPQDSAQPKNSGSGAGAMPMTARKRAQKLRLLGADHLRFAPWSLPHGCWKTHLPSRAQQHRSSPPRRET